MGQALAWTCELVEGAALVPGVETKCVGRLVLTQDDLDEAQVVTAVTITATDSANELVEDDVSSTVELTTSSSLLVGE
ncbi:unnamed protein product [Ectocarpus fasciculatus]